MGAWVGVNISRHVFTVNQTGRPLCPPVRDVRPAAMLKQWDSFCLLLTHILSVSQPPPSRSRSFHTMERSAWEPPSSSSVKVRRRHAAALPLPLAEVT